MVFAASALGRGRRSPRLAAGAICADRGAPLRLLGSASPWRLNLILYFLAIRYTGVAVAIFLSYLAPLYLAFVAPRPRGGRTERVVYVALGVGLAGMALILVPGLSGEGVKLTPYGLLFAVLRRRHVHGLPDGRQAAARAATCAPRRSSSRRACSPPP